MRAICECAMRTKLCVPAHIHCNICVLWLFLKVQWVGTLLCVIVVFPDHTFFLKNRK